MSDLLVILDQLDEARAKATPGPWRWDSEYGEKGDTGLALTNDEQDEIVGAYNYHCCDFRDDPTVNDADAALIVAAVNAAPKLTAALRAVLELADEVAAKCPPDDWGSGGVEDAIQADLGRAFRAAITAVLTPEATS